MGGPNIRAILILKKSGGGRKKKPPSSKTRFWKLDDDSVNLRRSCSQGLRVTLTAYK